MADECRVRAIRQGRWRRTIPVPQPPRSGVEAGPATHYTRRHRHIRSVVPSPHDQSVSARPLRAPYASRSGDSRASGLLPGEGARELRSRRWHAHPHRHRSHQRLRPQPRGHSAQGTGADADRALLVRGDAGPLPQSRHCVSGSQRPGVQAAVDDAGRDRGARLSGRHHVHLHPADVSQGRARDVWPPVRGGPARQPEASAHHHHAHHQGGARRARCAAQRAGHSRAQAA